jgi:transposase InsO family protein
MRCHFNASTNHRQRSEIQSSTLSCRAIARQLKVAPTTVHRWRCRVQTQDLSSRPRRVRQSMSPQSQEAALALRKQGLTLDQCLDALVPTFAQVTRSTLHRLFASHGLGRLRQIQPRQTKEFKSYAPGFIHMDHFNLPPLGAVKRYCFIAIDRATRLAYLRVYDNKTAASASDFFRRALQFFPFRVHRLLTDNGPEFTNRRYRRTRAGAFKTHPIRAICLEFGISQRFTEPYTPATNGMAERFVGLCKQATVHRTRYPSHQDLEHELKLWIQRYNLYRKHGSIKRRTPVQEAQKLYKEKPELFTREPSYSPEVFLTY